MYCTNCGKWIPYDSPICVECAREAEAKARGDADQDAQNGAYQNYYTFEPISPEIFDAPQSGGVAEGRKKGLARAIVAAVLTQLPSLILTGFLETSLETLVVALLFTALPCAIAALCLGIASIKCFREARAKGEVLPIATLIIGIYATVNASALILVCALIPLLLLV